jgi:NAD(P)-dependent dehydrogenase (short-subunit alcohol dehydrogenase family)
MNDLLGRHAIVSGAARGIGLAIARRLVERGARVAVADLDADGACDAAAQLGNGSVGLHCDVRSTADVNAALETTVEAFGGLDLLVNNAGIEIAKPITELTEDEFDRVLDINVLGTFRFTKVAVPALAAVESKRDRESVVRRGHRRRPVAQRLLRIESRCHSFHRIRRD